jgi:hypothetical protein
MKRFALACFLILLVMGGIGFFGSRPARAQQVFTPNCANVDDTAKFTTIATQIGVTNPGTIVMPRSSRCAVGNLTLGTNIAINNNDGAGFTLLSGTTFNPKGPITNPSGKQIFFGPGTVSLAGNTSLPGVYSAWWNSKSLALAALATIGSIAPGPAFGDPNLPCQQSALFVYDSDKHSYLCFDTNAAAKIVDSSVPVQASNVAGLEFNLASYGGVCDGPTTANDTAVGLLKAAIVDSGGTGKVVLPKSVSGQCKVSGDITFLAGTTVDHTNGMAWLLSNGHTLVEPSIIARPDQQICYNCTAGHGTLTTQMTTRYARWWGSVENGDVANAVADTAGIQAAINSIGSTATLRPVEVVLTGVGYLNTTVLINKKNVWLHGNGWGNASTNQGTALVWAGSAGIPMIKVTQAYGPRITDIRLVGDSANKPSAAVEFFEDVNVIIQPFMHNVWIGNLSGYDTTGGTGTGASGQFVNGILFDGANTNNSEGRFDFIHIANVGTGVNISDTQYGNQTWANLYIEGSTLGFTTKAAGQLGFNWVFGNNDVDMSITESSGSIRLTQSTSEGSGRYLSLTPAKAVNFECTGCSFQVGANLNADGYFIDTGGISNTYVAVSLQSFRLYDIGGHGVIVPKIRMRGNFVQLLRLVDTIGITAANLDVTPNSSDDPNAVREIVFEGYDQSTQAPYFARNILSYPDTVDLTRVDSLANFRSRGKIGINAIPGSSDASLRIVGGGVKVEQIATPSAPFVQSIGTPGATTYTYYVVLVDKAGNKTLPSAATVFATGNAVLDSNNSNQIIVGPVPAGTASVDFLKTNTATLLASVNVGNGMGSVILLDQGQSTSAYTAPTRNSTGDAVVDGSISLTSGAQLNEGLLASTSGVNMNTATATLLYTCPTGKTCVVTKVIVSTASTSLTTASYSFGWNSAAFDNVIANATHTELTGATLYTVLVPKVGATLGTTTGTFKVLMNTLQGGAATARIDVFGFTY